MPPGVWIEEGERTMYTALDILEQEAERIRQVGNGGRQVIGSVADE